MTEEALVKRAQNRDSAAFESLIRAYHKRLLVYAQRHVSEFDAEEIVPEPEPQGPA